MRLAIVKRLSFHPTKALATARRGRKKIQNGSINVPNKL
jgi:hypothetical protein